MGLSLLRVRAVVDMALLGNNVSVRFKVWQRIEHNR